MSRAAARGALCIATLAVGVCVAGCAGMGLLGGASTGRGTPHTPSGESPAPEVARGMVTPGQSTKADVAAALGPAIVIPFPSGYEVWVYRWPEADRTPRAATELVVLFDPTGRAAKARVRPGYPIRSQPSQ